MPNQVSHGFDADVILSHDFAQYPKKISLRFSEKDDPATSYYYQAQKQKEEQFPVTEGLGDMLAPSDTSS